MPMINADDGCPIHVQVEGREGAPVLMLSNSLGTNLHMWDDQTPEFTKHFRVVRYDRRGHGKSGVPKGPYSMERFGRDVLAVARCAQDQEVQLVRSVDGRHGRAMARSECARPCREARPLQHQLPLRRQGAVERPHQIRAGKRSRRTWSIRTWSAGSPKASATAHRKSIARMKEMFLATSPIGYIASCEAIRDMDFTASNPRISAPTLVIVGNQDPATPPAAGEAIAKQIKGAKVAALDAAHIANIEQPKAYTETVLSFLH